MSVTEEYRRISGVEGVDDLSDLQVVFSLCARMPVGVLTIKGKPRSSHNPSGIVNTPSEIEGLQEAFND